MIDNNYEAIIHNYIEKFDYMNNEVNDETYKWAAFAHFQKHWNINASNEDFPAMIKESFKGTSNLINNSSTLPATGICKLAEFDPVGVKKLFNILVREDNGDIKLRQNNIESFVDEAESLMEKHIQGSWKFRQDFRVALFYLNLIFPNENYVFKATEAREFADRVSFAEDFGSGKTFSLQSYYKMCDSLLTMIQGNADLLRLHESRWAMRQKWDDAETNVDDNYHILVYDILFSAKGYNLYMDVPVLQPKKRKPVKDIISMKNDTLYELDERRMELVAIEEELSAVTIADLVGLSVNHKNFGDGKIRNIENERISVEFSDGIKKFKLPDAFSSGFLKTNESEERIYPILQIAKLLTAIEKKKGEISTLKSKLNGFG